MKYLTVFSDASWDNSGAAAYAFFVRDSDVIEKRAYPIHCHVKQSTYAELYGMCCAILHAIDSLSNEPGDVIVAQTDCQYVIQQFANPSLPEVTSVMEILSGRGLALRFKHVKAHTDKTDARSYVNRWCDVQARRLMRVKRSKMKTQVSR